MQDLLTRALRDRRRLATLGASGLLDTPPEPVFDRVTRLAARVARAPIALLSLFDVDREYFKSSLGLPLPWIERRQVPISHSLGKAMLASRQPLRVSDARAHPLLSDSPALNALGLVAYLGVPLTDALGDVLGALAVVDARSHAWTDDDLAFLVDLGIVVSAQIALLAELAPTSATGRPRLACPDFRSNLPAMALLGSEASRTAWAPPQDSERDRMFTGRVLVVDHRADSRHFLMELLTAAGLTVVLAGDGREAMETALVGLFDLMVMDMDLPELDGFGVAAWLRRSGFRAPIVGLADRPAQGARANALRAGCTDHLIRPFEPEQLLRTIADCLDRRLGESLPDDGRMPATGPRLTPVLEPPPRSAAALPVSFDLTPRDDPELADLVREFERGMRRRVIDLRAAIAANDRRSISTWALQTKGVAAVYGYPELGVVAADLERAVKANHDTAHVGEVIEQFASLVERTIPTEG